MANPDPSSIASQIMNSKLYLSGENFTPRELYSTLHVSANRVTAALATLADRGDVDKIAEGVYRRPKVHWIFKQRLANEVLDPDRDQV